MICFFPSDIGCKDIHRHDGAPVGPAQDKAGIVGGRKRPLYPIGSLGVDFHHGQKLDSASPNRPKIRLQSVPFVTTMVAAFKKGNFCFSMPVIRSGPPPIALSLNHGAQRCQGFPRCARRLAPPLTPSARRSSNSYGRSAAGGLMSSGGFPITGPQTRANPKKYDRRA